MIVAEMTSADVPVEVLGLQIEGEGVGQQRVERGGDLGDIRRVEIGRGVEIGGNAGPGFAHGGASC